MNSTIITKCDAETLLNYLAHERERRKTNLCFEQDRHLLESNDGVITLNNLYALSLDGVMVGFAVTPKYQEGVLIRLYVEPEHRRKGVGRYAIDHLQIKNLGCLTANVEGQMFYQALDFQSSPGTSSGIVIFKRS